MGVYLPCGNLGMEVYQEQLEELERVVLESKVLDSVVVMGDFNAHLGILAGVRGQGGPNMQGVLLEGVMRRCGLYAASQSEETSGPNYTYWSGEVQSTVDYILMDVVAASMASPCVVHEMQDLNTSDHLPISVCLHVITAPIPSQKHEVHWTNVEWRKAEGSRALEAFRGELQSSAGCGV